MIEAKGRDIDLEPAPRRVPLGAQLGALFGGTMAQIGWGLMAFTLIFFWVFAVDSEAVTKVEFLGAKAKCDGKVVRVADTNAEENETPIMAVHFTYEVAGKSYDGTSYAFRAPFDKGDTVRVEYLESRPHRARIEGMRARTFGFFTVFVVLFPIVAFFLIAVGFRHGVRARRLLRIGKLGYGRLVGKVSTNASVNDQPVYKLTFEFMVPPEENFGTYRKKWTDWAETHQFHIKTHDTARLEDEAMEPLLFNPNKPGDAVLIDSLPGKVRIDGGRVAGGSLVVVILPFITVTVHGLIFIGHLL